MSSASGWLWRRPAALLLALLLALDAALGAGAAAPRAEHVSRTLAAAALAVRAAATASSQCSGTTSPSCTDGATGCSTSSDLSAAECNVWLDFFDSTGGAGWADCSQNRLDPCACYVASVVGENFGNFVECQNSHITRMYARGSHVQHPWARSRRPLSPPRAHRRRG